MIIQNADIYKPLHSKTSPPCSHQKAMRYTQPARLALPSQHNLSKSSHDNTVMVHINKTIDNRSSATIYIIIHQNNWQHDQKESREPEYQCVKSFLRPPPYPLWTCQITVQHNHIIRDQPP